MSGKDLSPDPVGLISPSDEVGIAFMLRLPLWETSVFDLIAQSVFELRCGADLIDYPLNREFLCGRV